MRTDDDGRGTALRASSNGSERRQRVVPSPLPPPVQAATHAELVLVATRLAAMEEQLTSYFAAMAAQANAARLAAETARNDGKADMDQLSVQLRDLLDRLADQHDAEQRSLRTALDQRLADYGSHQDWRVTELEARLERLADDMTLGLDARVESAAQALQLRLDQATSALTSRVAETEAAAARAAEQDVALKRRLDEATSAIGQRIEESLTALAARMDERNVALSKRIEENTVALQRQLQQADEVHAKELERLSNSYDDRLSALELRVGEEVGTRVAALEATIGRVSSSVDEAMVSLSQRLADAEASAIDFEERLTKVTAIAEKVDEEAIEQLKEKLSNAIGEATLVHIEMDRLTENLDERFDRVQVRMAEVESKVADSMDVSTAVQLDRLEELERAVAELDPSRLVGGPEPGALRGPLLPPPGHDARTNHQFPAPDNTRPEIDAASVEAANSYYSTDGEISLTSW